MFAQPLEPVHEERVLGIAQALALTIPAHLLILADEVFK